MYILVVMKSNMNVGMYSFEKINLIKTVYNMYIKYKTASVFSHNSLNNEIYDIYTRENTSDCLVGITSPN